MVGGGIQVEDPRGDRFDSECGIRVDGTDSTGSDLDRRGGRDPGFGIPRDLRGFAGGVAHPPFG